MVAHRFAELFPQTQPAFAGVAITPFVACPVFTLLSPVHQAAVAEIYRIAAEQTREQLRPKRSFVPAFSRN